MSEFSYEGLQDGMEVLSDRNPVMSEFSDEGLQDGMEALSDRKAAVVVIEEDPLRPRLMRWRVYYNCRDHFPFLAAVDNGTIASQIRVQFVNTENVRYLRSSTDMGQRHSDPIKVGKLEVQRSFRKGKQNEPTWWIEFNAFAEFAAGGVTFHGE